MEKQRKFLLVLPLLIIPFLTMAFWALGGGKGNNQTINNTKGLDTNLPEAQFKKQKEGDSKMAVYQQSSRDSVHNDGVSKSFLNAMGLDKAKPNGDSAVTAEDQTQKIQAKLAQLNQQINKPQPATTSNSYEEPEPQQVKQLRKMMKNMNSGGAPDPEMQQLNKMLDKIQAIQNPGSVVAKPKKAEESSPFKAIPAIIDGKQKVMDGGAVKLKLTDTVTIKKQLLPKGQELFGVCQVTNQRLLLIIQNIRLDKQIIPVSLTVFSLDGMPGIPAPEAELGGAASNGADNALQSMQFMTMDQSLGAQAAAGGVNAAKGLFSKKVKKIKVKLQNEYPVLLKINK